jgi:hypothetical protein
VIDGENILIQFLLHTTLRLRAAAFFSCIYVYDGESNLPVYICMCVFVCCTTAAAACMVIRTVCDCFKHCPQWYSTNGSLYFAVLTELFWCMFVTCTGWLI